MLYTYSIMPLDTNHIDEIVADCERQYKKGISICPLFMVKIHAEGKPPIPKAEMAGETFDMFRERLKSRGVPCGILAQSTIGHGYKPDEGLSFTPYIELTTGEETSVSCPYDPEWLSYMKESMATLARHKPSAIMLDDDCRLLNRPGRGCACPRHMAEFNRRTGKNLTREQLWQYIQTHSDDDPLTTAYLDTQRDAIRGAMIAMREGVDSVNPKIQGINCLTHRTCEIITDALSIFAGKGNPTIVRLPNGSYAPLTTRGFSESMLRTAATLAALKGQADVVLAETDTIPFNRYGKSAAYLKGHFVSALLDGCSGAKHWITRLSAYEPKSGEAFRKVLAENAGLFRTVSELAKEIEWVGANIPFAPSFYRYSHASPWDVSECAFADCVLERMGIPFHFSDKYGKTAFISGNAAEDMTDDDLRQIFRGAVFLSSDAAEKLIARGFKEEIGVDVRPYNDVPISGEVFENGNTLPCQVGMKELLPICDGVKALSYAFHLKNDRQRNKLFPAVTQYIKSENSFTVVFSGTPKAAFNYMEAFAFLNETRKAQFVKLLKEADALPVYADTDAELLVRAGFLKDGSLIVATWNLGLDVLDEYRLNTDRIVSRVEVLKGDGTWSPLAANTDADGVIIKVQVLPMNPVILRLTY